MALESHRELGVPVQDEECRCPPEGNDRSQCRGGLPPAARVSALRHLAQGAEGGNGSARQEEHSPPGGTDKCGRLFHCLPPNQTRSLYHTRQRAVSYTRQETMPENASLL
eukprot:Polyplicarium_translucidae@DN2390_c1_g1_i1.p1